MRDLPGGVDQYMQLARAQVPATIQSEAHRADAAAGGEAQANTANSAKRREARKAMERAERRMTRVREQIDKLGLEQADVAASVSQTEDYTTLASLGKPRRSQGRIGAPQIDWLDAAEQAENYRLNQLTLTKRTVTDVDNGIHAQISRPDKLGS